MTVFVTHYIMDAQLKQSGQVLMEYMNRTYLL